jgi:hypothetical protein
MKPRHTLLLAAIIALPVVAGGDRPEPGSAPVQPAFSQGMILSVDPSGKISGSAPQTSDLRATLGDAVSTSQEGLVVEKSPVAGGGVMVNLQGRFQNAMVLEVDENGNVTAPCVTGTPSESTGGVK